MMSNKVLCINSNGKPNEIETKNWVVEGEVYSVVKIVKAKIQGNYGFVLEEISPNTPEFFGYDIRRFGVEIQDIETAIKNKEIEYEMV